MNQKKSTTLYGSLMSPLTVGHCALIRYQGQLMRTSKVVAIHSRSADIPLTIPQVSVTSPSILMATPGTWKS